MNFKTAHQIMRETNGRKKDQTLFKSTLQPGLDITPKQTRSPELMRALQKARERKAAALAAKQRYLSK